MSVLVDLDEAKAFLDVFITSDDAKLQSLLDGAEDEAAQYMGYDKIQDFQDYLDSSENPFDNPPDAAKTGIKLLLQAAYQTPPEQIKTLREAAQTLLMPYRVGLGV